MREARDHYLSAVDGVREYLGRYVQCVTTRNGLEDCSSEFRRLSNAHTEFEKSVENFGPIVREAASKQLPPSNRIYHRRMNYRQGAPTDGNSA